MGLFLTGINPSSFSSPPSMYFLAAFTSASLCQRRPVLPFTTGSEGSRAPTSNRFLHLVPTLCFPSGWPELWEASPKPSTDALEHFHFHGSFFSWCILWVRINSHPVVNRYTALLPVLSTACATFYNRSLYSAPNSMEPCALFHWILSHFFTRILRVTQFCISSFCVFMNSLNLASLAKFYQHTPNFCTITINRNTK